MKNFLNILKYALFLSLVVTMAGCGGSDDPGPGEDTTLADALAGFTGTAAVSSVDVPTGASADLDWTQMTVTFSGTVDGGDYNTQNSANTTVWPGSGKWTFTDATGTKITRDDGVVMTISSGTTSVETSFTIDTSSGRTKVVDGTWKFVLTKQ